MRKLKRFAKKVKGVSLAAAAGVVVAASSANAAIDTTGWTVDMGLTETVMGLAMIGLLSMWGFRKSTKTVNRT